MRTVEGAKMKLTCPECKHKKEVSDDTEAVLSCIQCGYVGEWIK